MKKSGVFRKKVTYSKRQLLLLRLSDGVIAANTAVGNTATGNKKYCFYAPNPQNHGNLVAARSLA